MSDNNNINKPNLNRNTKESGNGSDERRIKPSYGKRLFEDSVEYSTMPKYSRPGKPGNK